MAEILSLEGREVFSWARASLTDGLAKLAERKNVPLDATSREALADEVLGLMDFASIHKTAHQEQQALIGMLEKANAGLDALVLTRMWKLIAGFEGKNDILDPTVRATAQTIIDQFTAALPDKGAVRWPDPMQLVAGHYATVPRGPVEMRLDDGTVMTSYWLGMKLHRNPKDGPAMHFAREPIEGWEYWCEGHLHRPHEDGSAVIHTHYNGFELYCEEYREHGQLHRPSVLGPAVTQRDRTGRGVLEIYAEHGKLHRDPKQAAAWFEIRDAATMREPPTIPRSSNMPWGIRCTAIPGRDLRSRRATTRRVSCCLRSITWAVFTIAKTARFRSSARPKA
jgi:hypothetical protein